MTEWRAHVITVSDGVYHGTRRDESGDVLEGLLAESGARSVSRTVVSDDSERIQRALKEACHGAELVVTTGGTGFGPRDVTPEATSALLDRTAPGLVHLMLAEGVKATPMAALSRPVAGVIGTSVVLNLPGSPKGAAENLSAVLTVLPHAMQLLAGDTEH